MSNNPAPCGSSEPHGPHHVCGEKWRNTVCTECPGIPAAAVAEPSSNPCALSNTAPRCDVCGEVYVSIPRMGISHACSGPATTPHDALANRLDYEANELAAMRCSSVNIIQTLREAAAVLRSLPAAPEFGPEYGPFTDGANLPAAEPKCDKCGQVADGQGGEYPCAKCGQPTLHDAPDEPKRCEHGETEGHRITKRGSWELDWCDGPAPDGEVPQTFYALTDECETAIQAYMQGSVAATSMMLKALSKVGYTVRAWNAALRSMKGADRG